MQAIERQAAAGIAEAVALILVVDGQTGVTGADEEVVSWLRRTHPKKPVRSCFILEARPLLLLVMALHMKDIGLEVGPARRYSGHRTRFKPKESERSTKQKMQQRELFDRCRRLSGRTSE